MVGDVCANELASEFVSDLIGIDRRMQLGLLVIFLGSCVALGSSAALVGGKKPLRGEEFKSEHVLRVVKFATSEIHKQKMRNGEVNDCVRLNAKILRGSTQVVAGTRYNLELRVSPVPVTSDECANKVTSGVEQFKPEVCEVEVLSRPWKQPALMEMPRSVCLQIED